MSKSKEATKKILILSDIHFSEEDKPKERANSWSSREECLSSLDDKLEDFKGQIDVLVIAGDLAWKGKRNDYYKVIKWLNNLKKILEIDSKNIIICPGNHDLNRDLVYNHFYPPDSVERNKNKLIERIENNLEIKTQDSGIFSLNRNIINPFYSFSEFQDDPRLKIPPLKIKIEKNTYENYLVGVKSIHGIKFVVFNSCWYSRYSEFDKKRLWIGENFLRYLTTSKQIPSKKEIDNSPLTIFIFHHPPNWFHEYDQSTIKRIKKLSTFFITGHTHDEVPSFTIQDGESIHIKNGALYDNSYYGNSFVILTLKPSTKFFDFHAYGWNSKEKLWNSLKFINNQIYGPEFVHELIKNQYSVTFEPGDIESLKSRGKFHE